MGPISLRNKSKSHGKQNSAALLFKYTSELCQLWKPGWSPCLLFSFSFSRFSSPALPSPALSPPLPCPSLAYPSLLFYLLLTSFCFLKATVLSGVAPWVRDLTDGLLPSPHTDTALFCPGQTVLFGAMSRDLCPHPRPLPAALCPRVPAHSSPGLPAAAGRWRARSVLLGTEGLA